MIKFLDTAKIAPMPWKNGGGITRGLSIGPEGANTDAFDWRVTLADIGRGTFAFSCFPGVERFTFVTGGGMSIARPGAASQEDAEPVHPFVLLRVAGEETLQARLDGAPIRAFNLMVRRASASGQATLHRESGEIALACDVAVFYCARGAATLAWAGEPATLQAGEAVEVTQDKASSVAMICDLPDTMVLLARVSLRK
jgi:hypothetical protein